jgi:hypothetical protein
VLLCSHGILLHVPFLAEFWENWYIIGENDPGSPDEFKFVAYNGKTRQNTYGTFSAPSHFVGVE